MKYRKIGNSDISVSEIGFGAWSIAMNWWGKAIDEQEAKRMIKYSDIFGITGFETPSEKSEHGFYQASICLSLAQTLHIQT